MPSKVMPLGGAKAHTAQALIHQCIRFKWYIWLPLNPNEFTHILFHQVHICATASRYRRYSSFYFMFDLQMIKKRGHVGAVNPAAKRVCREDTSAGQTKGPQRSIFNFLNHWGRVATEWESSGGFEAISHSPADGYQQPPAVHLPGQQRYWWRWLDGFWTSTYKYSWSFDLPLKLKNTREVSSWCLTRSAASKHTFQIWFAVRGDHLPQPTWLYLDVCPFKQFLSCK